MIGAISNALSGLTSATKKVDSAAERIANVTTPQEDGSPSDVDLATEAVNLKIGEIAYKANISVLQAAKEMSEELGRLFDKKV